MPALLLALVLFLLLFGPSGGTEQTHPQSERLPATAAEKAESSESLARAFPEQTLLWIEAPDLAAFLDEGVAHPLLQAFEKSELGQRTLRDEEGDSFTLRQLVRYARGELGFDPLQELARATRRGVALGVQAREGEIVWTILTHAASEEDAEEAAQHLREFGDDVLQIIRAGAFVVAGPEASTVSDVASRLSAAERGETQASFADGLPYKEAMTKANSTPLLRAIVNVEGLETFAQGAGEGEGLEQLRALANEAGAHILLGSELPLALGNSASLFSELHVHGEKLNLRVVLDSDELLAAPVKSSLRLPQASKEDVLRGVLHRDIEGLFARRESSFDAEALAGFAEFADNAALFLGGADFERDVLPGLSKSIGVVARQVSYDSSSVPEIPLPGVALLFELTDPERLGPHLSSAFQAAVALASIDRAQEGQPPLLLDLELVEGVAMTTAQFLPPFDGDVIDVRFNLEPACAREGELFIVGTHAEVVRSVVRDLRQGGSQRESTSDGGSFLHIRGPAAADLFAENLETLVMNQVLDEGISIDLAQEEMEQALSFLRSLEWLEAEVQRAGGSAGHNHLEVSLSMELSSR